MSRNIIITPTAFRKAFRITTRIVLAVGYGLGMVFLAPALTPQALPAPASNKRITQPIPAPEIPASERVIATSDSVPTQPLPLVTQENSLPDPRPVHLSPPSIGREKPISMVSAQADIAPITAQQPAQPQLSLPADTQLQVMPKAPQVVFEAGQLTIVAENSTLADILSSVRACTGADIDLPPSASGERIWARLGPGPARKILASLLSETPLDYVIQASDPDKDPDGIRSVLLTPRNDVPIASPARAGLPAVPSPRIANSRPPEQRPTPQEVHISNEPVPPQTPTAAETPSADQQPAATVPTDAPTAAAGAQTPAPDAPAPSPAPSAAPAPNANLSDQMMHMLQNMYEERKQQVQGTQPSPAAR
jgi:hypothetical protein